MMDLSISGTPEKDSVVFTLDGESGTVDPFSGKIHFSLEEKKTYRLFFRQKSEQNLPRFAEILLNILFLPVRGVFNVLTFNANSSWEKDICGYKISGYMDITLKESTELSFSLKPGSFDKTTGTFSEPAISFSPKIPFEQTCLLDAGEINKAHRNHVLNICSAGLLCLALLLYLFFVGWKHAVPLACMVTSGLILCFGALIFCLNLHSFRKRDRLRSALTEQSKKTRLIKTVFLRTSLPGGAEFSFPSARRKYCTDLLLFFGKNSIIKETAVSHYGRDSPSGAIITSGTTPSCEKVLVPRLPQC